jgi:hypothetical protein
MMAVNATALHLFTEEQLNKRITNDEQKNKFSNPGTLESSTLGTLNQWSPLGLMNYNIL